MKKSFPIALSIAVAQLVAVGAYAQAKSGEAAPPESAPAMKKATPMEKADAKAARKGETAAAAKSDKSMAEGESGAMRPAAAKLSKEEKAAARAKRKAATVEAAKKGEIPSGETGTVK